MVLQIYDTGSRFASLQQFSVGSLLTSCNDTSAFVISLYYDTKKYFLFGQPNSYKKGEWLCELSMGMFQKKGGYWVWSYRIAMHCAICEKKRNCYVLV